MCSKRKLCPPEHNWLTSAYQVTQYLFSILVENSVLQLLFCDSCTSKIDMLIATATVS